MQVRNKPDKLTNTMINEIGKKYLADHPKSSFLHSNQDVANALVAYADDKDTRDKWLFLADQLMGLYYQRKFGQLSKAIAGLLSEAFPALRTHLCSDCQPAIIKQTLYDPINRYYNDKLYSMVRSLYNSNAIKSNIEASAILSQSSPLNTKAAVYPSLEVAEMECHEMGKRLVSSFK